MLNKFSKVLLIGSLSLMIATPFTSFADDNEVPTQDRTNIEQHSQREMVNPFRNPKGGQNPKLSREDREAKRLETISNLYPEILDDVTALDNEHKAIHEDLKAQNEEMKTYRKDTLASKKDERKTFIADLREKIKNGEITNEEAATEFDSYIAKIKEERETLNSFKEEYKTQFNSLKEQSKLNRENRKALREELNVTIKNNDSEGFKVIFDKMIPLFEEHINLDNQRYELKAKMFEELKNLF
ncbi:hypothetical protein [Helicovermis profundi]|uniref:Uncharacterized protein n=1 Tax=Helicovermis profundi TaxID=3065157 RepID=A0AAU9EH80_9FIRM|nr:hypothetical protein HLPR_24830 [Clostridia bacterium S502]